MVDKIQMVINTLQTLDIKSTYENMNALLGCIQALVQLRDEAASQNGPGNPANLPPDLRLVDPEAVPAGDAPAEGSGAEPEIQFVGADS